MEIRQLRYFVAIVDYGSISKAGGQLNIAQPALSQQIKNLEHELGVRLLERSARGVSPTTAGTKLYRHSQLIIGQVKNATADVMSNNGALIAGTVTVGFPTTTAAILAVPLIETARRMYPGIKLRIIETLSGHLLELLMKNKTDLAIQFRGESMIGVQVEPMLREELFLVTSDPEKNGLDISVAELATIAIAAPGRPHMIRQTIDDYCESAGVEPNVIADIDSLPALRRIASSGIADVILPWGAFALTEVPGLYMRRLTPRISRPIALSSPPGAARNEATAAIHGVLRALVFELVNSRQWRGVEMFEEFRREMQKLS